MPGSDLVVSRLSFGTAALHHVGGEALQASHLEAAAAAGFTHFDTAPLYGFGAAERALGEALGGVGEVTVATKVGLYPPGGCDQVRVAVFARKAVGKLWPPLSRAVADLSVARARASLEGSLRRLQRPSVDLMLLHEPDAAFLATDEWLRWIESEGDRVRCVGIAGPSTHVRSFLNADSPLLKVIQTQDSVDGREADFLSEAGREMQLTYGYFSSKSNGSKSNVRSAEELIRAALARNTTGSVVVSTRSKARLGAFARILAQAEEGC